MLSFGASWGPVPWAMPSEMQVSSLFGDRDLMLPDFRRHFGPRVYRCQLVQTGSIILLL